MDIIISSLIGLVSFELLILIIQNRRKQPDTVDGSDQYIVLMKQLEIVVTNYKTHVMNPKLEVLSTKYDTNTKSQTNALTTFLEETAKIEHTAVRDIIDSHLTDDLKDSLNSYFTEDSLILFIIAQLKE